MAASNTTIVDGERNVIVHCTGDVAEAAYTLKVDMSGLSGTFTDLKLCKIHYAAQGCGVNIWWDATADDLAWTVPTDESGTVCFKHFGGLVNPKSAGWTGDIGFTTVGHAAGDTYAITLHLMKRG